MLRFSFALLLTLTACGPTPGTGPKLVRIYGELLSAPDSPLAHGPVILTQVLREGDRDVQQVFSDSAGRYVFRQVPAGTYRVRFSHQPVQLVSSGSNWVADAPPALEDGAYFETLTTHDFTFDGHQERVIHIAPITPTWKSQIAYTAPTFTWAAAPEAQSYQLQLQWPDGSSFFESPTVTATSYTLTSTITSPQTQARLKVQLNSSSEPGPLWGYSPAQTL